MISGLTYGNQTSDLLEYFNFIARMPKNLSIENINRILMQALIYDTNAKGKDILELHTYDEWENMLHKEVKKDYKPYYINIINDSNRFTLDKSQVLYTSTLGAKKLIANTDIEDYAPKSSAKSYDKKVVFSLFNRYLGERNLIETNAKYTVDNLGSYTKYDKEKDKISAVARFRPEDNGNQYLADYLLICFVRDYAKSKLRSKIRSEPNYDLKTEKICNFTDEVDYFEYCYLASLTALIVGKHFDLELAMPKIEVEQLSQNPIVTKNQMKSQVIQKNSYFDFLYQFRTTKEVGEKLLAQVKTNDEICIFSERLELARSTAYEIIELLEELINEHQKKLQAQKA
jgi:hypothetical protein